MQKLSNKKALPQWGARKAPIYDIHKTWEENCETGPDFNDPLPKREWPDRSKWKSFLGIPVASAIGVPAGPLLNSKWTTLAAQLGFDIISYKTIRSQAHPCHPLPNIVFVETSGQLNLEALPNHVVRTDFPPFSAERLAITNSFGMPSRDPEFLQKDISQARKAISDGQILIVSVMGTNRTSISTAQDFARAAVIAAEGGAQAIEVDLSCPNVRKGEGQLFTSMEAIDDIIRTVGRAVGNLPLIIKVGVFPSRDVMKNCLEKAARAGVRAVCGINTIAMPLIDSRGRPAMGPLRPKSGICGSPIREAALQFVRDARNVIEKNKLDLCVMACGGITMPEHFDIFRQEGADVALSATGMMWDPYLAMRYHQSKEKRLGALDERT